MNSLHPNIIASKIAQKVVTSNEEFVSQEEDIRYGLEWIIGVINQILIVALLALPLGFFKEAFAVMVTGSIFRFYSGGAHLKGYFQCLIVSTFQIILAGYITSTYNQFLSHFMSTFVLLFIFSLLIVAFKAPVLNKKKHLFSSVEKRKLKYISIILFITLVLGGYYFFNATSIMYSIWFGVFIQVFSLTNLLKKIYSFF